MANFSLSNTPRPIWLGGPNAACSVCKFRNESEPWYLILENVECDQATGFVYGGERQGPVHLCATHATELKAVLDEVLPDERLASAQAALFKAEAARARAEKSEAKAVTALAAMQDWIAGDDAK